MSDPSLQSQRKTSNSVSDLQNGYLHGPEKFHSANHIKILPMLPEKIVTNQVVNFFTARKLIDLAQHGFLWSPTCPTCHFYLLNLDFQNGTVHRPMLMILSVTSNEYGSLGPTNGQNCEVLNNNSTSFLCIVLAFCSLSSRH